jgi:hypothetical protein
MAPNTDRQERINGVLRGVGQMRAAILHLGDLRVGIVRVGR